MNALSRREEEALLKVTKARALKECDEVVKEFANCTEGRSFSLVWACREQYRQVQKCMLIYTGPESMSKLRSEYIRLRGISQSQKNESGKIDSSL